MPYRSALKLSQSVIFQDRAQLHTDPYMLVVLVARWGRKTQMQIDSGYNKRERARSLFFSTSTVFCWLEARRRTMLRTMLRMLEDGASQLRPKGLKLSTTSLRWVQS